MHDKKGWLGGAVKKPALTGAAKAHGVSKLQEAERESHPKDPRGRGALGMRLIKGHGKP